MCGDPNDPDHPQSPYCVEHRQEARRASVRLSRQRSQDADALIDVVTGGREHQFQDGVYSGPAGIVLVAEQADRLRADLGLLASTCLQARSVTGGFKPGMGEEAYRRLLIATVEAAEDFNEILTPVLRRRH